MGSGQSSQSNTGSFSVDPSGNISYEQSKPKTKTNDQSKGRQPAAHSENGQLIEQPVENKEVDVDPPKDGQRQQAFLGDMPSKEETMSLREADEIVSRMKLKFKANSAELAGKNKSTFEDIERDLTQCYRDNRDQPIKCLELTKSYNKMVVDYRSRVLKNVDPKVISAK